MGIKTKDVNDTIAGFTISMSLTVAPTLKGMGARAPTSWEQREGARPYTRSLPLYQTKGLLSLRSPDPTPSPRGRAPDSRSGTTGHGRRAPTFTNGWARGAT